MAIRTARVKVFRVAAQISNKTYRLNEEVNENQFASGVFDDLVKAGKLELAGSIPGRAKHRDAEPEFSEKEITEEGTQTDPTKGPVVDPPAGGDPELDLDDTTRAQLMADLDYEGIKYSSNATKKELFKLLMDKRG